MNQVESTGQTLADMSVALTGSGGSGVVTAGEILLDALARAGFCGLMTRSAGPQIRGGESAVMLRFSRQPVDAMNDRFDVLVGLDWLNVGRFLDEIPLDAGSRIFADPAAGPIPGPLLESGARVREYPFKEYVDAVPGGRVNMAAIGVLGAVTGLPLEALEAGARGVLANKRKDTVSSSIACIRSAYANAAGTPLVDHRGPGNDLARWCLSGNEATGLGALRAGVRFVAAYPITPASEILEWLAPRLEQVGGSLLQAEDELASINMIIGASFGGVPSLTATSGPGLSLMMEGLGLAVASETPVVVVNVQRGGPSTGLPTKSEQSDLNIALYGLHGDAPHLVLAPLSIGDCAYTTHWAAGLAEHLQAAAIVLSDQSLAQSRAITPPLTETPAVLTRRVQQSPTEEYARYALTEDGVSPMTLPGVPGGMYTADGLEHNEQGAPSTLAAHHLAQLGKRRSKLEAFEYGDAWAEIRGAGGLAIVTWGSASGAVFEAASRLETQGRTVRVIAVRLLAPLRSQALAQALDGAEQVWV
ncbi:MAG: 2-oxoacid:acceptor oxidoreductase subunit alpha, partial [Pseudomonadota bacterium]|nr:2-oxoacid:acceptor oxidoreductase subunit alpha [Pseudomonadota bacterium]